MSFRPLGTRTVSVIFDLLADLAPRGVVEWVPRDDSMVQAMLIQRENIFPDYAEDRFAAALSKRFTVAQQMAIPDSSRVLFGLTPR